MKKVFLLSLLIPICFIPSATYPISGLKLAGGIASGLVSAASGALSYAIVKGPGPHAPAPGLGLVLAGAGLLSAGSGILSAVLLNPTDYSSSTVAKLGAAAYVGGLSAVCGAKAIKYACKLKNSPNDIGYKREAKTLGVLTAITGAIAAGAVYSALDNNWHLKA